MVDFWKENILENLEFELARKFLTELKKKFEERDNKLAKIAELKQVKQGLQTMKIFVQVFKWAVRDSWYEGWVLVEEFKKERNNTIRQRLMKTKQSSRDIRQ